MRLSQPVSNNNIIKTGFEIIIRFDTGFYRFLKIESFISTKAYIFL